MLIHLDTSVLVDAFTGPRRSLAVLESTTINGEVLTFCSIVLYEWLRGPRIEAEVLHRFLGVADCLDPGDRCVLALQTGRVRRVSVLDNHSRPGL